MTHGFGAPSVGNYARFDIGTRRTTATATTSSQNDFYTSSAPSSTERITTTTTTFGDTSYQLPLEPKESSETVYLSEEVEQDTVLPPVTPRRPPKDDDKDGDAHDFLTMTNKKTPNEGRPYEDPQQTSPTPTPTSFSMRDKDNFMRFQIGKTSESSGFDTSGVLKELAVTRGGGKKSPELLDEFIKDIITEDPRGTGEDEALFDAIDDILLEEAEQQGTGGDGMTKDERIIRRPFDNPYKNYFKNRDSPPPSKIETSTTPYPRPTPFTVRFRPTASRPTTTPFTAFSKSTR